MQNKASAAPIGLAEAKFSFLVFCEREDEWGGGVWNKRN
ncbi:hypothetical protein Desru_0523 [Desulforamulus ruminis DSM 2154]|uniref:Uncharacterized protein n=1 Tax=Desulforamulus ruminis (strain ATCC 23193 / DSM 2154 / NCIMB 8452 / DL) TaxID=696281 RepID=F6DS47_DESRL|nr:hypothetical protein Desru_0523 [Desulforamulus ruminis DSM 2154]